jgi:xanthine dehydrogenase iron-sulfur cluster and FAD-binding subunit A
MLEMGRVCILCKSVEEPMWNKYVNAATIDRVVEILSLEKEKAKIIAGATDLWLEMERGVRTGIDTLIDITRISKLDSISLDKLGNVHIGPLVTHNNCASSEIIRNYGFPLGLACWKVGSPQIRNRGTVAGNIITASPANDTITPLVALGATVVLKSKQGERAIPINEFYLGVRKTQMNSDELMVDIYFPMMTENSHGTFIKAALRKAQAISTVNVCVICSFDQNTISGAVITLGAVAPTIIHAKEAEVHLIGKSLENPVVESVAQKVMEAIKPIDDLRGSADYRKEIVRVITKRALEQIRSHAYLSQYPSKPITLDSSKTKESLTKETILQQNSTIETIINGKTYKINQGFDKNLLRLIRENGMLTGTKEGCAEGECGACTLYLDGKAVMSCLIPAPRAHMSEIVTIEGISKHGELHPVQNSFVEEGAVQCGYCTPGFIMSGAKLLEENPKPSIEEIKQSITGNLCRCTGYYKIVKAIEKAALG